MAVIAMCIGREAMVEFSAVRNQKDFTDAEFAARAGLEASFFQLMAKLLLQSKTGSTAIIPLTLSGSLGKSSYSVEIESEAGKFNINYPRREQLQTLTAALGINQIEASVMIDSILDWRDPDSLHLLNGAENDYYLKLKPPYRARNGPFESIEELLLVRGVTPEIFYGRIIKSEDGSIYRSYGLSECLTIYSPSTAIDLNYAPLPVLMALPGMTPPIAAAIDQRRKIKPFGHPSELSRDLNVDLKPETQVFLTTEPSFTYTLTATGQRKGSKVKRSIRSVVQFNEKDPTQYEVLRWDEPRISF
jgi:general secretion pathway protein K